MAATTDNKTKNTDKAADRVADYALRQRVMKKVTVQHPTKVDIKPVGSARYRINVWAETDKPSEDGFFRPLQIVQTFYHID